jgi:uncharacterized protein YkwD
MRHAVVVVAAISALTVIPATGAGAHPTARSTTLSSFDHRLLSDINHQRQMRGIPALTLTSPLESLATSWAHHEATAERSYDNPHLEAQIKASCPDWKAASEVVGKSGKSSATALFQSYYDNPTERQQLLARKYTELGIRTVASNDRGVPMKWNAIDLARGCP